MENIAVPTDKPKLLVILDEKTEAIVNDLRKGSVNVSDYVRECLVERNRDAFAAIHHIRFKCTPSWGSAHTFGACKVIGEANLSPYSDLCAEIEMVLGGASYYRGPLARYFHLNEAWGLKLEQIKNDPTVARALWVVAREFRAGNISLEEFVYPSSTRMTMGDW